MGTETGAKLGFFNSPNPSKDSTNIKPESFLYDSCQFFESIDNGPMFGIQTSKQHYFHRTTIHNRILYDSIDSFRW